MKIMEYKLSNYKSAKAILKRTWTMGNHFSRSQLFHPDFQQPLYSTEVVMETDELPVVECCTAVGYIVLTTKHLYVKLQEQCHKVEVEKINYQSKQEEILARKLNRHRYMEYDFYSLATSDGQLITYAVNIGFELILDKCLSDMVWMVEKFRKAHNSGK